MTKSVRFDSMRAAGITPSTRPNVWVGEISMISKGSMEWPSTIDINGRVFTFERYFRDRDNDLISMHYTRRASNGARQRLIVYND